jgi:ABC-type lipoprotein release transport system permease subunit
VSLLPWEYGIRNLLRRPLRSGLTLLGLTTVVLLVLVVVGFIRGLERALAVSGDPRTVIVFSLGMGENLEYSSVPMRTSDLVAASIVGVQERHGKKFASPELYLGTQIRTSQEGKPGMGLVRGVTPSALLVHSNIEIIAGDWPQPNEVMIGRLAATKIGATEQETRIGQSLWLEGREWRISGVFSAAGAVFESEVWCRLDGLQQAMKRQDLSLVALMLEPDAEFQDVDLFCKERLDLELQAVSQIEYFQTLRKDYAPVRMLAWLVAFLIFAAGVFAGLNTMYGAVVGRVRELATLRTLGFQRRAAIISIVQEGTMLAVTASLIASVLALLIVNGSAMRFTMGAFELQIDSVALFYGCGTGLALGILGSLPPALRVLYLPVVDGLKSI